MSNFRQYMSTPQEMVTGPTRGNEARSMIMQQAQQQEADEKIAAETARREAREDSIRAEDRSYYEAKEAKDRTYYEEKEAQQRAQDDARYAGQSMSSYSSGYANQTTAAVNPQSSGQFLPSSGFEPPTSSPSPASSGGYVKPSGDRSTWSTNELRGWKEHRGVTDKYS